MRNSVILAVTTAALASSFLVPSDAIAASRGFAHAAMAHRSVRAASTGSVRTASIGFRRSTGFQRPATVASSSFTQRRFGSANTAVGHSFSFGNRFSTNHVASNALIGPHAATTGQAGAKTQTPSNAQVITDLTNRANADKAKAKQDFNDAQRENHKAGDHEKEAQKDLSEGLKHSAKEQEKIAKQMKADAEKNTKEGDKELNAAKVDTTAANGLANKGNGDKTGTGGETGTGDKKGGGGTNTQTGGGGTPTNANNIPGGGNHPHPFPGQFPVGIGMGHGPVVGGLSAVGVPVVGGGSVAPVVVGPVASGGGAVPPVTAPSMPRPQAPSCLTKTYLQTGVVMFRDVCSQEWALNSSSVTNPAPVNSACLRKENPQNGVVLFKDNCTSEWAMNPQQSQDNQAQAN